MPDMYHRINIRAHPDKVYKALTTEKGLRGWWTADTIAQPKVGSIAEFGFGNHQTLFRMKIDELNPGKSVIWSCLGDVDEWMGTRLTWSLSTSDEGTLVQFTQTGWPGYTDRFATCNTTWGHLMYRLKAYVETGKPNPVFS
jgi:uncharacterized protein YndB with AHSA1/START domain